MTDIIRSPQDMMTYSDTLLQKGRSLGFIPTMGALHKGHLSLVERSKGDNDLTIVSIFVNPAQFSPSEDLDAYPRDLEGDVEKLNRSGADIVFVPSTDDLYPDRYRTYVSVEGITNTMCGEFRPGHFRGVATIVAKLFNIVRPSKAYFGQKDYQQVAVIKALVRDLDMGVTVVTCPIVREDDGLAMSSRNSYLSREERRVAPILYRSMKEIADRLEKKRLAIKDVGAVWRQYLVSEPLVREIQYASAYDPYTLEELTDNIMKEEVLLAAALYIGNTRLIDNMTFRI